MSDKFEPNTGSMKVQLKSEFQKMKLVDPDKDPDPWTTYVEKSVIRGLVALL